MRGEAELLERDAPLQAIANALTSAATAAGTALLLVGHAGMGKTRVLEAARDTARADGLRVVRAAGAELEQNIAFGVAGQLLRALSNELPAAQRRALIGSAPPRIRALQRFDEQSGTLEAEDEIAVSHGLFTLLADATETEPVLIEIDDLHWCDAASLQFLLYCLHRLDELAATIVMAVRPGTGEEHPASPIGRLYAHPRVEVITLEPLGLDAVGELVHRAIGDRTDPALIQVCLDVTSGNPFYLHELLLALADEPGLHGRRLAEQARSLAPDAVTRSLRLRIGRLGDDAVALARAVAILGEDVPLRHAAALSGLSIGQAAGAADSLAAAEILRAREPLSFVHPLVRHAVERDTPASQFASRHLDAARMLYGEGAGPEHVAAHLLVGRAQTDPWVVERLLAAAREARSRGAPQSAARYLERALEEPPSAEARPEVLAALGISEAAIGSPAAAQHLAQAAEGIGDPRRRAELALKRGHALYAQGLHEQAAAAYDAGLAELPSEPSDPEDRELHDQLQTGFVTTASFVASLQPQAIQRSEQLLARAMDGPLSQGQRLLLGQASVHAAFAGRPAAEVQALAERAWDSGELLRHGDADGLGWSLLTAAFDLSGDLERSLEIADAAAEDARHRDSPLLFASASYVRVLPHLWRGEVDRGLADFELAWEARRYGWRQWNRAAAGTYCLALIETGQLELAEQVLTEDAPLDEPPDLEDAVRVYALSELRRAQRRPAEALELALTMGPLVEQSVKFLGYCPWRISAAESALVVGDRDRAFELARESLARAEQTQVTHERIGSLRVLGMSQPRAESIETLRAAVELGASAPPRLETIRALVEFGGALRRANERAAARGPLQQAADLASQGGASVLYQRARTELSATGARPRRNQLLSGPASLTPSERRIAALAAAGQTNREIATVLFVTPKTVEYHLRNAYRKLDIRTRNELAGALEQ
ncbi:MAG TPA: AAA family ATPase [Solirubrobacteraceae bacterium]|nr:AAA family ATPase [Solirubrobacteraceae bacterium]